MSQASFQKQQREKARRERTAAKEAKRVERGAASAAEPLEPPASQSDQSAVLTDLAVLHERFESGDITFDDFEVAKQELVAQLDVR